jgi:Mg2+-importing ATPase
MNTALSLPNEPHLKTTRVRFANMLVAVDLSASSANTLKIAADLAYQQGARLVVAHVLNHPSSTPSETTAEIQARIKLWMKPYLRPDARVAVIVAEGDVVHEISGLIKQQCSTGTLTLGEMRLEQHVDVLGNHDDEVLRLGYLNSVYQTGVGNAMDKAVHHAASRTPLEDAILREAGIASEQWNKIREIPFDFERRRVSIILEREGEQLLIVKGAPESLFPLCSRARVHGQFQPLDQELREAALLQLKAFSGHGLRVLAVAAKTIPPQTSYSAANEYDLTCYGFLAFSDPPLADALDAIHALAEDGISVKILTGDNDLVARHICGKVGLTNASIVTGDQLSGADSPKFRSLVEENNVFARVTPSQKTAIIEALRKNGHVVGFMGDGINDAPSLRAADVGISVANAVDVAREAADIILLEPGLHVLHKPSGRAGVPLSMSSSICLWVPAQILATC